MKYTLDYNILINMERLYPREIFVSLWDLIEDLASRGEVCICDAVLRELQRGDGDLHAWAKKLHGFTCPTHRDEALTVKDIAEDHPDWVRGRDNEADPWVIAHGLQEGRVIVTEEKRKGPNTADRNQRIPNIASKYKVQVVKFFEFVKAQGWTF